MLRLAIGVFAFASPRSVASSAASNCQMGGCPIEKTGRAWAELTLAAPMNTATRRAIGARRMTHFSINVRYRDCMAGAELGGGAARPPPEASPAAQTQRPR